MTLIAQVAHVLTPELCHQALAIKAKYSISPRIVNEADKKVARKAAAAYVLFSLVVRFVRVLTVCFATGLPFLAEIKSSGTGLVP